MKSICDVCEAKETNKTFIDRESHEEKAVCLKCYTKNEICYIPVDQTDAWVAENFSIQLMRTEKNLCELPDDAWDAIASVISSMERGIIGDFLRIRGLTEKAKAVEGVHHGLLHKSS